MAKITLPRGRSGQSPRVRGGFYTIDTRFGPVAVAWPKRRGPATEGYNLWRQKEFGIAASMASNPYTLDYQTALHVTEGTQQVPRDFLMMCAYGSAYIFEDAGGGPYRPYREVNPNPQQILDQVTETHGSILYRDTDFWRGLDPGDNGQVLTLVGGKPSWQPSSGGSGTGVQRSQLRRTTDQAVQSTTQRVLEFEEAVVDPLGVWNPSFPDRIYIPANCQLMKLTVNILSTALAANENWIIRSINDAGQWAWYGSLRDWRATLNSNNAQRAFTATSIWFPPPETEYLRIQCQTSTSADKQYLAHCAIDVEAVIGA